jgi:hypothetical protein
LHVWMLLLGAENARLTPINTICNYIMICYKRCQFTPVSILESNNSS